VTEATAVYGPTHARNCVRRASGLVLTPYARMWIPCSCPQVWLWEVRRQRDFTPVVYHCRQLSL